MSNQPQSDSTTRLRSWQSDWANDRIGITTTSGEILILEVASATLDQMLNSREVWRSAHLDFDTEPDTNDAFCAECGDGFNPADFPRAWGSGLCPNCYHERSITREFGAYA